MNTLWHSFAQAVSQRDRVRRRRVRFGLKLHELYKRKLRLYQAAKWPGRKRKPEVPEEISKPWADALRARYDTQLAAWGIEVKNLESKVSELAARLEQVPCYLPTMVQVGESYSATYSSQGFGASSYARGRLEIDAEALRQRGYQTEIRTLHKGKPDRWGICPETFGLFVNGPACLREALRHWPISIEAMQQAAKPLNLKVYHHALPNYWEN
jgi:hypothetical protein